jgi:hypothetical protein
MRLIFASGQKNDSFKQFEDVREARDQVKRIEMLSRL